MERQFLVILSICLLASCQTTNNGTLNKINDIDETLVNSDLKTEAPVVIEEPPKDVWEYIINKSLQDSEIVINDQALLFMNNHIKDVENFNEYLNKSYYFIYYVVQELEAANLPVELAFIPFIESNYDPFSISPSGAVGLWQFMPKTGRLFNLEKSWWSEDRHDPYRSTHAAIGYFKYLFERFDNDIYLALAAYNAGPTYLDRQIRKNKRQGLDTDFFSLNLSKQVTEYIPKYIAIRELVFNAEKYGIVLPKIPVESVVQKVEIPGQVEIITLSDYLGIKPELLYKLNAGYTKWASAPKDKSVFYIPIDKAFLLDDPESPFENVNQINWISHVVSSGDSLWSLARKYDTEVRIIKEINYIESDLLSISDTLLIPLSKMKTNNFIPYEMHIVSEGDTLWEILNPNIANAEMMNMDIALAIAAPVIPLRGISTIFRIIFVIAPIEVIKSTYFVLLCNSNIVIVGNELSQYDVFLTFRYR